MGSKKLIVNTIIGIIIVVVLFFGYRFIRQPDEPADAPIGLAPVGFLEGQANIAPDDEFLTLLLSLQSISLASDVYPTLRSFVDFSTELQPQTPGRDNPFAPIGRGGRTATSSTAAVGTTSPDPTNLGRFFNQ